MFNCSNILPSFSESSNAPPALRLSEPPKKTMFSKFASMFSRAKGGRHRRSGTRKRGGTRRHGANRRRR